eukprot:929124_1
MAPTTSPTVAPTASPSQPPSLAPSFSPSTAPSAAPTSAASPSPTNAPSHAPTTPTVIPTNAPSNAPTVPTLRPTPNPTAKVSCGSNKYCYSVDVVPIDDQKISTTMAVSDRYPGGIATYYDVSFNIWSFACNRPSVTFTFEPVDNDVAGEYLYVYYLGETIGACLHRKACNTQKTCIDEMTLGNGSSVAAGQTIVIHHINIYSE